MTTLKGKFINLFTDFGFKKIFGEEPNKDLLIAFLNALFQGKERVKDLTYLKNERLGRSDRERKAVYDLYCENEKEEKFIVEVQRVKQEFFKDRSIYYASFALQEQAQKGRDWQCELKGVYTIAILDFTFVNSEQLEHRIKLIDEQTHQVFYEKLSFIYLEIPKFDKKLEELQNDYERWLYAFQNLHKLTNKPDDWQQGIFKRLLDLAEIAEMPSKERDVYQESLKDYLDLQSAMKTYFKEGKEEGKIEIAKTGIQKGYENQVIQDLTGLSLEEIEKLRQQHIS